MKTLPFDASRPRRRAQRTLVSVLALVLSAASLLPRPARGTFIGFEQPSGGGGVAEAQPTTAPTIEALYLENGDRIQVDGRLDEAAWQKASSGGDFRMWDPDRGSPPSQPTIFKVAYDHDAIYFAVACLEDDPSKITKKLSRRDRSSNSDLVSVYVDPYLDHTTGYNFRVNPLGVQQDIYIFNDGEMDEDWDAVWQAETYQDDDGWYAELRVPFSSIRYRTNSPAWGLNVYRYMHGRGEDTAWVTWDRETPGFVSRFGQLIGLRDVPSPRQLEVLPYVVARATDPSTPGDPDEVDGFENFGADLKYGVTADLTLNATVQPDFGQVESDPAVLNLSPHETFFNEKRPFFVEGNRFFEHPDFNLFYSRRIGTGDANSRIRYAAKLTGKAPGNISMAALVASTDVTEEGQTHNLLKNGARLSRFFVGRFGKESKDGARRVNVMQTAVVNTGSRERFGDRGSREAFTTGADFQLQFLDRAYTVAGSFVGSIVDPEKIVSDPDFKPAKSYGTGGELEMRRSGGKIRGGVSGRWESDRLDINDMGFLQAPDDLYAGAWMTYLYNPKDKNSIFTRGNVNLNLNLGWLYADRTGYDLETGEKVWAYGQGHRQFPNMNVNGWFQTRSFREFWWGVQYQPVGTQRYETRNTVLLEDGGRGAVPGGGPLISEPTTYGGWVGAATDTRKNLVFNTELTWFGDVSKNHSTHGSVSSRWNQSAAVNHELELSYNNRVDDTQHIDNFENPGAGIGSVSFVFGEIHQKTADITLRTSLLFDRNKSLEIYAQPFLTVGDYRNARELIRADSYDLIPYTRDGFRAQTYDFTFASVNFNAVYRWEYRPGSTLFLVWTQSRSRYDEQSFNPDPTAGFDNGLSASPLFKNEPENVFLAKVSYWFPV
jgi:hypothetical protein